MSIDEKGAFWKITDDSVDMHRTVFSKDGWDLERYNRNPIVTAGHPDVNTPNPDLIIGRGEIEVREDGIYSRIVWDEGNALAMEYKRKVDDGFIRMASIRASVNPKDAQYDKERGVVVFKRQTLLDWGIVMHGSNGNAQISRDIMAEYNLTDIEPIKEERILSISEKSDLKNLVTNTLKKI